MKRILTVILVAFNIALPLFAQNGKAVPRVPGWAKDAIWYQIFPERFDNGDKTNDPAPHDMEGAWPYKIPDGWHISPWTSDWYKLQPWEKADGHDFYWNAGVRRYGGDLQGVINRLDYLHKLGITAIYLNPIFESPSLHKYDTRMYHHVDNNFGPNPKEDEKIWASENPADPSTWKWTSADSLFLSLIKKCHKLGMKIIIDGVFNHVGTSFWAFQDVVKNQEKSPFKDWFKIKSFDNPNTPENEFEYEGWNGVKDLPEIKKDEHTGLVEGFGEHIHAIIKRWMAPNGNASNGIDGWRLDVAEKVNIVFWEQFRAWVKEENPNAYITGEIWWDDWQKNKMFNASPWLQGDSFDGVMNYRFAQAVKSFVVDIKDQISPEAFSDSIKAIEADYPKENLFVLQNLMDSHDVDRISSQIVNPDRWFDHNADPGQNKSYLVRRPNNEEIQKQKLIAAIQMTMPGAPMIYYGDEAGMWGGDDPDCRKPMVWPGVKYETEVSDPLGRKRDPDKVAFDTKLFNWYRRLISIRNANKILSEGSLEFIYTDNTNKVLGYKRTLNNDTILVILNNSSKNNLVTMKLDYSKSKSVSLRNLITGEEIIVDNNNLKVLLKPYEMKILSKNYK
ncbi:MAG: glycoside hydrolase family 13 protein [Ignavibacteriaceae bacterium]|nr:glycoside hydrolase family 13 protein [Ignavibacteriaceae bacterium]